MVAARQHLSFSGLRGTGKTTELNRLIKELNQDDVVAFYCDASDYLNLNNPQLTQSDLLMTALAGLSDAVRQKHGKDCLKESIWDRATQMLKSDILVKSKIKADIAGVGVELEATLRENPDFKKKLNEFAQESGKFYAEAKLFANDIGALIRRLEGDKKIVLIVDSLERLSASIGDESKLFDSLKDIFFNNATQLQFSSFSVLYTVPPYLHAVLPGVDAGFTHTFSLPNFKVMQRPSAAMADPEPNQDGLDQMLDIIEHRFPEWRQAMTPEAIKHLAWMSGGNVRRLFQLTSTALIKAALGSSTLPVAADARPIALAVSKAAEPLQWLNKQDRVWLERFRSGNVNPAKDIDDLQADLPSIMRLFDHSLVLNYQNGEVWYNVPPLVRNHV